MIQAKHILEAFGELRTLNEAGRSVINIQEIEGFIKHLSKQVTDNDARDWTTGRLRRYIINDFRSVTLCDPRVGPLDYWEQFFSGYTPNYARIDFDTGKEVYIINFKQESFKEELNLILDYLHSPSKPKNLSSISYDNLLMKALTWRNTKEQHAKNPIPPDEGTQEVKKSGSLKLVVLLSGDALDREGIVMHNCINGQDYGNDSKTLHPKHKVYSIRKSSVSVCSFLVEENLLTELKGPKNKKVDSTYHQECRDLINRGVSLRGVTSFGERDLERNLHSFWNSSTKTIQEMYD